MRTIASILIAVGATAIAGAAQAHCSRPPGFYVLFAPGAANCVEMPTDYSHSCQRMMSELDSSLNTWTRGGGHIQIIGHTDTVGPADANQTLSENRATLIRDLLVARGIPADQISAEGRGENDLMLATADGVAEPLNNRVLIDMSESISELDRQARENRARDSQARLDAGLPPLPPSSCP